MSLPDWLEPLLDAERVRALDRWAIEERGIAGLTLMERAGVGLAETLSELAPDGVIAIVCGKGDNGGDGYVAARLLREAGREVRVLTTVDVAELTGDAAQSAQRLAGDPPLPFTPAALDGVDVVVDALLGTGATGAPRGAIAAAVEALNACPADVVAADVPSGVDASTGEVAGVAVAAACTATFAAAKPGLWIAPGKPLAGAVHVVDIGVPDGAPIEPPDVGLIDDEALLALLPRRATGWTKFTSGHVVIAGGARGLTGAPSLAAEAAQRAGAGYVTVGVPASLESILAARLLEAMTRGLADHDGAHSLEGVDGVLELTERGGALVVGPGLGRSDGAAAFARALVARAAVPVVLDADGLNAHAGDLAAIQRRSSPTVLTPHEGELARLLGVDADEVRARRLHHVRRTAAASGAVVVLKGDDTLVARPDGVVAVSGGATAGLATAGTGDVLSGVIAAILARGVEPFAGAAAGVRLHARAGVQAAGERGADGVIARDVIEALPYAR